MGYAGGKAKGCNTARDLPSGPEVTLPRPGKNYPYGCDTKNESIPEHPFAGHDGRGPVGRTEKSDDKMGGHIGNHDHGSTY